MKLAQLHRRNHPASRPAPQRRSLGVYAHPLRSFADDLEMHPIVRAKLRTNVPHGRDDDTGKRTSCSCGGTCPHCRAQAMRRAMTEGPTPRPAGTDNLEETDLTVPRAGDAGVPADAGTDAGTPAPSCCDQAFSNGLAGTDYGGVICCNNVKHSCVWPSNMSSALTNASARAISINCARVHEDTHHDDVDCTGAAVERPSFKAGKDARAEECIAYRAEVACFDAHIGDCGTDTTCTSQITSRRAVKQGQADSNCA